MNKLASIVGLAAVFSATCLGACASDDDVLISPPTVGGTAGTAGTSATAGTPGTATSGGKSGAAGGPNAAALAGVAGK